MKVLKCYLQLLKVRLSISIVFSAMVGYLLGAESFILIEFVFLIVGGFFVTGSANGLNQILEKDKDKLMERTANRPLPQGNLTVVHALIFCSTMALLGLYLLNFINSQGSFYGVMSKSSLFGLVSILLYVLSYTPLKRVSTISIFVGAIPGAIPFLLGWVAATDNFGLAAGTLFAIQFFWQFPHFIAIAWVLNDEYKKAGFKMLFGGEKNTYPAVISIFTSVCMTLISVVPFFWKYTDLTLSIYAFVLILILGVWFTNKSFSLYKETTDESAKKLMLASFVYLPLIQIVYVLDKLFI